jgi:Zn-dependent peptidase ImmA (M78 family)
MKKSKNTLLSSLPKYFDVGWAKFTFVVKKNLNDGEGSKCFGITDFNKFVIFLEEDMSEIEAHHTIIHECSHAVADTLGLGGPEDGCEDKVETTNEIITEAMCRAFLMFKNLNPELWEKLFEEYYE